jgi:hypothetical protein
MTWPLAIGLTTDVPGDLGDSLLNMWILGWGAEHFPRVATAQMSWADFWNANIFHPDPLALTFSEHLFGQVLQILPIYHLTGNLILGYNVIFLSTFVLSGLGMYLLARDLLGDRPGSAQAAFIAGLIFAFVPYRIAQVAHIQSLSSQWMPLALYGFRRFITTRRPSALVGGSAALLMQNWSCGYYLIFFAPFVPLFVLHQIVVAGKARDWRLWVSFAVAGVAVAAGTWPFLAMYLEAQRVHAFERSLGEVIRFSADVFSYLSAPEALRLWGGVIQAYPKPEGELFIGVIPVALMLLAVGAAAWRLAGRRETVATSTSPPPIVPVGFSRAPRVNPSAVRRIAVTVLLVIVLVQLAGFIGILFTGGFINSFAGITIRATNASRVLSGIVVGIAAILAMSPIARERARAMARSPLALAIVLMALALWLSLGPMPQSHGQPLAGLGLYSVLYENVPGFDGLRVPARYAMIAFVFLSVVAAYGAAAVFEQWPSRAIAVAISVLFLIEAAFAPMLVNQTWGDGGVAPPSRVEPASAAPEIYQQLAMMDDSRVIVEFPFGDPAWELRYVYYSTVHWKRLVNGYSGGFPQNYKVRVARLQRVSENPDAAWEAMMQTGATNAIVHHDAFAVSEVSAITGWLVAHDAREVGRFGPDVLYSLPNAR